jgi:hypothetical protein
MVVVLGLAVAIAAISMLSVRVEQQTRAAFEAGLRNAMARLQRTSERTAAGVSKRRSTAKRAEAPERRAFARRRLEDVFPSENEAFRYLTAVGQCAVP